MHKLHQLTEQLASALTTADPDDLPTLARLHDQLRSIARLAAESGDLGSALQQVAHTAAELHRLISHTTRQTPITPLTHPPQQTAPDHSTLRVPARDLDLLINTVGRLAVAQSLATQDLQLYAPDNPRLARSIARLSSITHDLHDLSVSTRMAPLDPLFQKLSRLVQDLARKTLKTIEFVALAGHTELDRYAIDLLGDALLHIVRNAVDHGIETPAERAAAGKKPLGRISLRACNNADELLIQITDDGRGLNKTRILQQAVDSGFVLPSQPLDEQAAFRLIFHPGLTTARHPTDISGRGVGLDVAQRNVAAIRGRIDVLSAEGRGTTFTIRLPIALAEPHRQTAAA